MNEPPSSELSDTLAALALVVDEANDSYQAARTRWATLAGAPRPTVGAAAAERDAVVRQAAATLGVADERLRIARVEYHRQAKREELESLAAERAADLARQDAARLAGQAAQERGLLSWFTRRGKQPDSGSWDTSGDAA